MMVSGIGGKSCPDFNKLHPEDILRDTFLFLGQDLPPMPLSNIHSYIQYQ
jgi:hypothetical protein